nr:PAS domain-containing protein [uncultured Gellertiella sp.]
MPLRFDDSALPEALREEDALNLASEDIVDLYVRFNRLGSWRLDLHSSQSSVSRGVYQIYSLPYVEGPANMMTFRECIHPDDVEIVDEAFSTASERKCSFSVTYRLRRASCFHFVRTLGRHRATGNPEGELYGITFEVNEQVRELVFIA